ncbi:hypothetical protein [Kordia jejudonensis]|uniref:hypothetical protein n=1 Tax=Kordia jejudonensis TaxID=1348245 RepID=UPI00062916A2|nr:hypothetical protein [Kordia jejudonensis]
MEKVITLNNNRRTNIRSIDIKNNTAVFLVRINKEWLTKWARRIGMIAILVGYISMTIISYSISPVYFWTFIKAGTVLSLLFIISLSKN